MASKESAGLHVAFIMDGNGRWAAARKKPRYFGHRAGAETLRRMVEAAPEHGISTLTAYAFSSDNWQRPSREVSALMRLFASYLQSEKERLRHNNVKLTFIGRRDRFSDPILKSMEEAENYTAKGHLLNLRLAVDYSARDAILQTAQQLVDQGQFNREQFNKVLTRANGRKIPDVDLLIRTGGEQRLSDFLLWECAYAELYFSDIMWPDFRVDDLKNALDEYYSRERRFGRVSARVAG